MVRQPTSPRLVSLVRSFSMVRGYDSAVAFSDDASYDSSDDSSSSGDANSDDEHIRQLVRNLSSVSMEDKKHAAEMIRLLAKHIPENRLKIAEAGAVRPLICLISSPDLQIQEDAVTAILNLSLCRENRELITNCGGITPLIDALETGTATVKENAASALLRLSLIKENKSLIGQKGAIKPLVNLLKTGALRGKKDASTALYSLCSVDENKVRAVEAGIVKPLLDLMEDSESDMFDKSAWVLNLLLSVENARATARKEGVIPVLTNLLKRGQNEKLMARAMYLQLCQDNMVEQSISSRANRKINVVSNVESAEPFQSTDLSRDFTTNAAWDDTKGMINWIFAEAQAKNISATVEKLKDRKIIVACKKSEPYKSSMPTMEDNPQSSKHSTKSDCSFEIHGRKSKTGQCSLSVCGFHNHGIPQSDHEFSEYQTAVELDKMMKSEGTVGTFRTTHPSIFTSRNQNEKTQHKPNKEERGVMTMMQQFLQQNNYYVNVRKASAMDKEITDLFFAHRDAIYLLSLFPFIAFIDTSRKMNKYNMSLLEIAGFTSKGRIFNVAFAMMTQANAENYAWVLHRLADLYKGVGSKPTVIITDQELGNMRMLSDVFPNTNHLLCWVHIIDNIKSCWHDSDLTSSFCLKCQKLFSSKTKAKYEERLKNMRRKFPRMTAHLEVMWLFPYKKRIVVAWTMKDQYFDRITTYRNDLAHTILNTPLGTSVDTLMELVNAIVSLRTNQIRSVRSSLEESLVKEPTKLDQYPMDIGLATIDEWWKEVRRKGVGESNVDDSATFLSLIHTIHKKYVDGHLNEDQMNLISAIISDTEKSSYGRGSNLFEHQWMENESIQSKKEQARRDNQNEEDESMSNTSKRSSVSSCSCGRSSRNKGRGRCLPESDSLIIIHQQRDAAKLKVQDHSQPIFYLNFNWGVKNVDNFMFQFIKAVSDVESDGHCGYRALAVLLHMSQESFRLVRQTLAKELRHPSKQKMYEAACFPTMLDILIQNVSYIDIPCPSDRWLEMPIVGLVFATRYKVALVLLSWHTPMTCLPMQASSPDDCPPSVVLAFATVGHGDHFVPILLADNAPLPPLAAEWCNYHHPSVNGWDAPFRDRIESYQSYRVKNNRPTVMY